MKLEKVSWAIPLLTIFMALLLAFPVGSISAFTATANPAVTITSGLTHRPWALGNSGCSIGSTFYVFWFQDTDNAVFMSTSTDGQTWTAPTTIFTLPGTHTIASTTVPVYISCSGDVAGIIGNVGAQPTVAVGWVNGAASAAETIGYATATISGGTVGAFTSFTGPLSKNGHQLQNGVTTVTIAGFQVLSSGSVVYYVGNGYPNGPAVLNNLDAFNSSTVISRFAYNPTTQVYMAIGWVTTNIKYATSADFSTWTSFTSVADLGAANVAAVDLITYGSGFAGVYYDATPEEVYFTYKNGVFSQTQIGTVTITSCQCLGLSTDGGNNLMAVYDGGSGVVSDFWYSSNGGVTFGAAQTFAGAGSTTNPSAQGGNNLLVGAPYFSVTLSAFVITGVTAVSTYSVYAQVFGVPNVTPTAKSIQTLGSCPTKNTATFTPVNQTIYFYSGNALANEVLGNVSTFVASVTSGTHTLRLLVYAGSGSIASISNPITKVFDFPVSVTAGTTNNKVTASGFITIGTIAGGNIFGVGLVADDHFRINQSGLSGLTTLTGVASSSPQPSSFTSTGSSSATKLYLCGVFTYQSSVVSTVTTTAAASTTTTITTTNTINTIGSNLFTTASNWPVIFFILFLPAGLLLGATRTLVGAILGLMIGAVIGVMMGILPSWLFIGLVIATISIAFVTRERG